MFDKVLNSPLDTPPLETHCVKSVRIQSISPYSVRIRKKTEKNNSEYGHFSHSGIKRYYTMANSFIDLSKNLAMNKLFKYIK